MIKKKPSSKKPSKTKRSKTGRKAGSRAEKTPAPARSPARRQHGHQHVLQPDRQQKTDTVTDPTTEATTGTVTEKSSDVGAELSDEQRAEREAIAKEIADWEERLKAIKASPTNPIDLNNELMMLRWTEHGEMLMQKEIPLEQARITIRLMYERMNALAPHLCKWMLDDLIKAEIIQQGPQWDEAAAPSKMAWHLQYEDKHIEMEIDRWLRQGHSAWKKEYGPRWVFNEIVYRHYKRLRLEKGLLFRPLDRESRELIEQVWEIASEDSDMQPVLQEISERQAAGGRSLEEYRDSALDNLRIWWKRDPEIKRLKKSATLQKSQK